MTKITIGARGSKLSLAYVEKVKELLIQRNNDLKKENIDFKAIKTSGDINHNVKLSESDNLHLDEKTPISKGGERTLENTRFVDSKTNINDSDRIKRVI